MSELLATVRVAVLSGLDRTIEHFQQNQRVARAPEQFDLARHRTRQDYLRANLDAGFRFLREIGLGMNPVLFSGRFHNANEGGLSIEPIVTDPLVHIHEQAQQISILLYALHHFVTEQEALTAIGTATILEPGDSLEAILATGFRPGSDSYLFRHFDHVSDATTAWEEFHRACGNIAAQDDEGRFIETVTLLINFLSEADYFNEARVIVMHAEEAVSHYPQLSWLTEQVERYTAAQDQGINILWERFTACLEKDVIAVITDDEKQRILRQLVRSVLSNSILPDDSLMVQMGLAVSTTEDAAKEIAMVAITYIEGLYRQQPSWKNCWGRTWDPRVWVGWSKNPQTRFEQ